MHSLPAALALLAVTLPAQTRVVGVYYQPRPSQPEEYRRLVEGDPGGRNAFNHVVAPIVRFKGGEAVEVWREYLGAAREHGRGKLRCLLDAHVFANDHWLAGERLQRLLTEILESELADVVGGFYVCDEPLGRSVPGRAKPVDVAPIHGVVRVIRAVGSRLGREVLVYADYASVSPLLKHGGGHTDVRDEREAFLWNGEWVRRVVDEKLNGGKPIVRGYGFFGEDVTMVNWWGDAASLRKWAPRILKEVSADRLHLVIGYDTTPATEKSNAAWLARLRALTDAAKELSVRGFWFWSWQTIDLTMEAGGKRYKGLGEWWESPAGGTESRYAALVESLRR